MAYWSDSGVRATSFAGGSGTSSSPYLISTPAQLGYLCYLINSSTSSSYKSKYYKLTADLNMNANYWIPIGYASTSYAFTGNFDGDGHTISYMTINGTYSGCGLFGYAGSSATIKNLKMTKLVITNSKSSTATYVGCILGYSSNTTISNVYLDNPCIFDYNTSTHYVGGIVGRVYLSTTISDIWIDNMQMQSAITSARVGGITGWTDSAPLTVNRANIELEVNMVSSGGADYFVGGVELLEKQIREFHPKLVCVYKEDAAKLLKQAVADLDVTIVSGMDGLIEAAAFPETQIVVTAVVGMIGIRPTIAAIKAGKDIALANKETLVTAGHLIIPMIKQYGVRLLPVDSEHSAIFQSLMGSSPEGSTGHKIDKILLTASGGPFRGWTKEQMKNIRPEDALKHPNWVMGRKITIDSSTMVNKGLEVMEAKWLFGVEYDQVQVVIQPQSVIHSMVQFEVGAIIAQLGTPDMKLPIQLALTYPDRRYLPGKRLDFAELGSISFFAPDFENFPGLALAYKVGKEGGNRPTIYNAANEFAVSRFLDHKLSYPGIIEAIEASLDHVGFVQNPNVDNILETEAAVYEFLQSALA